MTPATIVARPNACTARSKGVMCTLSPNTRTPRVIPASGSAPVIAGNEACSGPTLKALCTSHRPIAALPITAYPGQVVPDAGQEASTTASERGAQARWAVPADHDEYSGDSRDDARGRPVRERTERFRQRAHGSARREDSDPEAQHERADELGLTWYFTRYRGSEQQREDQVSREERFSTAQSQLPKQRVKA